MATHRHRLQESRSQCSNFTSLRQFLFWVCSCNTITSSDVIAVRQILGQQSRWDTVQQNKHPVDVCIPLQRTPTSWMEWKKTQSQDQTGDNKRIEISLILDLYTHCNLIKLVLIEGCIHLRCCNFLIYLCALRENTEFFLMHMSPILFRLQNFSCIRIGFWKTSRTTGWGITILSSKPPHHT